MKIKLLKPYKVDTLEKPAGQVLDVTSKFGKKLIEEQVAEEYVPSAKALRPKKQEKITPKDK